MKASLWIAEQERQGRDWRAELKKRRRKRATQPRPATPAVASPAVLERDTLEQLEAVASPEVKARLAICKACEMWTGASCGEYQCSAKWRNDLRRGKCPEDRFV